MHSHSCSYRHSHSSVTITVTVAVVVTGTFPVTFKDKNAKILRVKSEVKNVSYHTIAAVSTGGAVSVGRLPVEDRGAAANGYRVGCLSYLLRRVIYL